jgi:hypothetical protein
MMNDELWVKNTELSCKIIHNQPHPPELRSLLSPAIAGLVTSPEGEGAVH